MGRTSLFCGLLLACSVAYAQQPGFYLGASVGQTTVDLDANEIAADLSALGVTNLSSSQDDSATAWKVYGGYQFNPYIGLEGGYADFGSYKLKFAGTLLGNSVTAKADADAQAIFVDLVGHLPLMDNALSLFAKGGFAYARLKTSASASAGGMFASDNERDSNFVWKLGAGFRYSFNKQFGFRAEYEKYYNVGDKDTTGQSDVNMWSVGATYSF